MQIDINRIYWSIRAVINLPGFDVDIHMLKDIERAGDELWRNLPFAEAINKVFPAAMIGDRNIIAMMILLASLTSYSSMSGLT